jgi:hypothetical protein
MEYHDVVHAFLRTEPAVTKRLLLEMIKQHSELLRAERARQPVPAWITALAGSFRGGKCHNPDCSMCERFAPRLDLDYDGKPYPVCAFCYTEHLFPTKVDKLAQELAVMEQCMDKALQTTSPSPPPPPPAVAAAPAPKRPAPTQEKENKKSKTTTLDKALADGAAPIFTAMSRSTAGQKA